MNKTFIFAVALFTLTIIVVVLRMINSQEVPSDALNAPYSFNLNNNQTEATPLPTPTAENSFLKSRTGEVVSVKKLTNAPVDEVRYGADTVLVDQGLNAAGDSLYQIFYFAVDGSIGISLLAEPLSSSRVNAERALKEKLNLSEDVLCTLAIRVTAPLSVSEEFSGRNLGLSFCPFATNL